MPSDPLAKWRRESSRIEERPEQPPPASQDPEEGQYQAFHGVNEAFYLKIRRAGEMTRRPYYAGLIDVIDDEPFGTCGALIYSFPLVVTIYGRNLREMFEALARHQVDWIQQYDSGLWLQRPDPAEPFIERIDIVEKDAEGIPEGAGAGLLRPRRTG